MSAKLAIKSAERWKAHFGLRKNWPHPFGWDQVQLKRKTAASKAEAFAVLARLGWHGLS